MLVFSLCGQIQIKFKKTLCGHLCAKKKVPVPEQNGGRGRTKGPPRGGTPHTGPGMVKSVFLKYCFTFDLFLLQSE